MSQLIKRREILKNLALGTGAVALGGILPYYEKGGNPITYRPLNPASKINHSVCRWCFEDFPLEEFTIECKNMGIVAIDLLKPEEWNVVEKHGIECSMATDNFVNLNEGFNDPTNHAVLQKRYRELIEKAADHGIKRVICFSGNRNGMDDATGIVNCAEGLLPLLDYAEAKDITLVMELLNSKVDHLDYHCDHTQWGVALADSVNRDNFKLLYDIYHMQIMEGDIISTIRKYHKYIDHYHTAGVPGRNEINQGQELNYPAIMTAIAETGFNGFVAQEFIPTYKDKLSALKEAVFICNL